MTAIQYIFKIEFNKQISYSDIPKEIFKDWFYFYELKEILYNGLKFKLIDSKDHKGFIKISLRKSKIRNAKSVIQMDMNGRYLKKFKTLKNAAIKTNSISCNISKCCNGVQKHHNGFKWKFADIK